MFGWIAPSSGAFAKKESSEPSLTKCPEPRCDRGTLSESATRATVSLFSQSSNSDKFQKDQNNNTL